MSAQQIPSLTLLEPVANYVAMQFADGGVSTSIVHQMLEVFQYHCVSLEKAEAGYRLVVDPAKLVGWISKAREKEDKIRRIPQAADVLGSVVQWYTDSFQKSRDNEVETRRLYQSLRDFLTLVTWKFKTFSDVFEKARKKQPDPEALRRQQELEGYAAALEETSSKVAQLARSRGGRGLNLIDFCQEVQTELAAVISDKPWRARLAVGLSGRSERRGPPPGKKKARRY